MIEPRSERGSVSVVAAGAICVALICTMGVADVGRVLAERSHAEAAADAAALAAAQDLALSSGGRRCRCGGHRPSNDRGPVARARPGVDRCSGARHRRPSLAREAGRRAA